VDFPKAGQELKGIKADMVLPIDPSFDLPTLLVRSILQAVNSMPAAKKTSLAAPLMVSKSPAAYVFLRHADILQTYHFLVSRCGCGQHPKSEAIKSSEFVDDEAGEV
jgi:hypothetical protein